MAGKQEFEIFVAINEDGDCECDTDEGTAVERLGENFGFTNNRVIKIKLLAALPRTVEVSVEAADIDETSEAKVA